MCERQHDLAGATT